MDTYSPVFLKARMVAFSTMALIGFAWVVLLCVDLYLQWDGLDRPGKSFTVVMLVLDTLTIFMVLILLALPFRPWLDAARCLFLLVTHVGLAIAFARWSPGMACPTQTPDEEGSCRLANFYILMASWVIPILVIVYAAGLGLMLYRRKRLQKSANTETSDINVDIEKRISGSGSSSGNSRESFFPEAKSVRNSDFTFLESTSSRNSSATVAVTEPRRSYLTSNRRSESRLLFEPSRMVAPRSPHRRSEGQLLTNSQPASYLPNRRSDLRISIHPRAKSLAQPST
ncbi:hypothetical protein Moror_6421 [Moniliophthora roreri MCA 2997]|uniref:Uncharacterized protein n=1 Tax=Moniliophthora roreri (strain MCA 2997) TaxID=1381753 RepID=V2XCC3_MONRO|nr:hypothetical protein Moror_6421 [Moniliophthora roreri MCA 2997]